MKRFLKITAAVFLSFIIIFASAVFVFYTMIYEPPSSENDNPVFDYPQPKKNERVNVLLLGVDAGDPTDNKAPKRSDTMVLASFDPVDKKLDLISIPRDTRVSIEGRGNDKIAHAHAYGGPELAMDTVSNLFGVDIHYYVRIDYEGFKKVVDSLGGVRVYVPMDMEYHDPYDDPPLHISLKKGWQNLNGEKAIQFVRYRKGYQNGDIGRVEAQQAFMNAVMDKVLSAGTIVRLPLLAKPLASHLSTNMSFDEMSNYAFRAAGIKKENIKMHRLIGEAKYIDGISYFIYDKQEIKEMIASIFDELDNTIKVEVLNGSGVNGLAGRVASMLEKQGFEVIEIGNADGMEYSSTHVYDRKGKGENARKVAKVINVNGYKVDINEKNDADVTVILGKDKSNL